MAENKVTWTAAQKAAIEERDKTLLVSAAAGSGKTAVLTERIIRRLTDKENPGDISRMLIVTFTKAAAGELKTRIAGAIGKAVAADPKNKYLRRQLLLLSSAKICTIHSFCLDVIKKNLKALGLPESISVANDVEMLILRREIMNDVINSAYNGTLDLGDVSDMFIPLSDLFSNGTDDDGMCDSFLSFYDKLASLPEGCEFLKICADETLKDADTDYFRTNHGKIVAKSISDGLSYILAKYSSVYEKIKSDETVFKAYSKNAEEDLAFITSVADILSGDEPDVARVFADAYSPSRLASLPRGYSTPLSEEFKEVREEFKDIYKKSLLPFLTTDPEEYSRLTLKSARLTECLYRILSEFSKAFGEEKKKLSKLDFSDIERYAYKLLEKDGAPTPEALEIRSMYDEVYIDEYQDTNSVQDRIFTAVSTPRNRFMVGDIKQSIYGFRGAAPENFAHYRDLFPTYSEDCTDSENNTIFLSDNFRCDGTVVDFCNTVFSCIFRNTGGNVAYLDSDNLVCSKAGGRENTTRSTVVLAAKSDDPDDTRLSEAEYIASEISRLIKSEKKKDGTRISPGDIAVLVRAKASSVEIEKAINALDIPTSNNIETEFFENPEILTVMALLNTIDNPMRDIYLAGILKSPIFDFTLDELALIRAYSSNDTLYEALVKYTEETGFEKGKAFLERLSYFRTLASGERVDRLLKKLYRECGIFAMVSHNKPSAGTPEAARENLTLLYTYARDFEASSYKGLHSFIKFVDDIIERKTKLASSSAKAPTGGAVRLMTVHQSKGLEFPIVFVAATHKPSDGRDKNPPLLIDSHVGVSFDLPGKLPGAKIKSPHRQALEITLDRNRYEEEMRVLYVALTRARERLYVTGEYKEPDKELARAREKAENICPHVIMKKLSYMQLVLIPLIAADKLDSEFSSLVFPKASDFDLYSETVDDDADVQDESTAAAEKILDRISFTYPHGVSVSLPAKMSVSALSKSALDTPIAIEESEKLSLLTKKISKNIPEFIAGKKEADSAQKGTATHEFMQFCDYTLAEQGGIDREIDRLVSRKFISAENAELIDRAAVEEFFKGSFYLDKIKSAEKIWREYRFNADMPASLFTSDTAAKKLYKNETLFVQGIVDCFIKNSDGSLTLIDYKTDHIPFGTGESAFVAILKERHSEQLAYYRYALEQISKAKVKEVVIYSFALGRTVDVTEETEQILGNT